jgi:hypothetical protein
MKLNLRESIFHAQQLGRRWQQVPEQDSQFQILGTKARGARARTTT